MLLELRVRNFRSIRDEQVLSLVASRHGGLASTHVAPTGLRAIPGALRAAVVFGANASGKSTLLSALHFLRAVVAESATVIPPGQAYNVPPFRLDPTTARAASEFEITFLLDGVRHQYGFEMTPLRIEREWLLVYRTSKPRQLFDRRLRDKGDQYEYSFSDHLFGARKLWQESTRPNALFLSTAAQLNSELLGPVFRWIVERLVYLPPGAAILPDFTTAMLATPEGRGRVLSFLTGADTGISDITTITRKGLRQEVVFHAGGVTHSSREENDMLVPQFAHVSPQGKAMLELHEESDGTQRLYGLAAPVLDALHNGRVLVVDELGTSLHSLLVRNVVKLFHDPSTNPTGAQLVFSTHDTSLLDPRLFRRDQIWFTEKNEDQATRLYPLSDFSPRADEAWARGYLAGRYGAVPFLGPLLEVPGGAEPERTEDLFLRTSESARADEAR